MISTAEQSYAKTSKHDAIVRKLILPSDCLFGYLGWYSYTAVVEHRRLVMSHGSSLGVSEETMKSCLEVRPYIHNWVLGHLEWNSNSRYCINFRLLIIVFPMDEICNYINDIAFV